MSSQTLPRPDLSKSTPPQLARLLALASDEQTDELASIWRRLLELDVPAIAGSPGSAAAEERRRFEGSFGQLLGHAAPPLDNLIRLKQFAKRNISDPDSSIPHDVASALYYAAIAVALLRHGQRITQLNDTGLCVGFGWCARQAWLDRATRRLIEQGLARVEADWGGQENF